MCLFTLELYFGSKTCTTAKLSIRCCISMHHALYEVYTYKATRLFPGEVWCGYLVWCNYCERAGGIDYLMSDELITAATRASLVTAEIAQFVQLPSSLARVARDLARIIDACAEATSDVTLITAAGICIFGFTVLVLLIIFGSMERTQCGQ